MTKTGQGRGRRFVAWMAAIAAGVALLCSVAWFAGIRFNLTASYPVGFWRLLQRPVGKGDLVFFHAPLSNPAIHWAHELGVIPWRFGCDPVMMKRIVAVPGDRVAIATTVTVNDVAQVNSQVFAVDQAGRTIPRLAMPGIVPAGTWFLLSDYNERSFDSRYFGPIDQKAVLGVAEPLWTW